MSHLAIENLVQDTNLILLLRFLEHGPIEAGKPDMISNKRSPILRPETLVALSVLLLGVCVAKKFGFWPAPGKINQDYLLQKKNLDHWGIMTFNVENLFDTTHALGKLDYTFLPLRDKATKNIQAHCKSLFPEARQRNCLELDWNSRVLGRKLQALARTILQVHQIGPDILVLQEVENRQVLEDLRKNYLSVAGYLPSILVAGDDPRGINVGILTRFKLATSPRLHRISGARGILEVKLELPDSKVLTVLGFHLPSQQSSKTSRKFGLDSLIARLSMAAESDLVIAAGDSNLTSSEEPDFVTRTKQIGELLHHVGCKKCYGTYYFKGLWSFFDWIFISRSLLGQFEPIPKFITTPMQAWGQVSPKGIPTPFRTQCNRSHCVGVSDHLPVYAEFRPREQKM